MWMGTDAYSVVILRWLLRGRGSKAVPLSISSYKNPEIPLQNI